jgi:hypothetical protein
VRRELTRSAKPHTAFPGALPAVASASTDQFPFEPFSDLKPAPRCVRATSAGASTSCTWSRTRRRIRSGRCVRPRRAATRQQFPDKRDEIAPPHVRPQPQDKASNGSN